MMDIEKILNKNLNIARDIFNQTSFYKHILIPNFDCSVLTPPEETNGKDLPDIIKEKFFSYLHQFDSETKVNNHPCLYVFELVNEKDIERVINAFKQIKKQKINRTLPAIKTTIPNSKCLYVGKVEKEVGGRLVTHLGYYQKSGNHGLQLAFWLRDLHPSVKINVHVFRFNENMRPYIVAFEKILAKELNPIIGKHK